MTNERLILAIGQMERALSRIETAQTRANSGQPDHNREADADLAARHHMLKTAAGQALAGIDAILAGKG